MGFDAVFSVSRALGVDDVDLAGHAVAGDVAALEVGAVGAPVRGLRGGGRAEGADLKALVRPG